MTRKHHPRSPSVRPTTLLTINSPPGKSSAAPEGLFILIDAGESNNLTRTCQSGGYKDGLRAEDYRMNGPRLLSKGGVCVRDEPNYDVAEDCGEEKIQSSTIDADKNPKEASKLKASTPITKYMWDDSGSGNVAKIHIDSLPASPTKTMTWESAGISREQVEVRLIGENGEGLHVSIITRDGERYHLHVAKTYGAVESAKCIVKKHKLLVKIVKKKIPKRYSKRHVDDGIWKTTTQILGRWVGGGDEVKEEYTSKPWPTLTSSSGGGGGIADIDESLFKRTPTNGSGEDDLDQWGM